MKFLKIPAVFAALIMGSTSAFAFTSIGNIESINPSAHIIRLQNGDSYKLPSGLDLSGLSFGQRVAVTWETQDPNTINIGGQTFYQLNASGVRLAD